VPHSSAICTIVIHGSFDPRWSDYVEEVVQSSAVEDGNVVTTTLFVRPADLAAFIGLLHLLVDFHIPVIACDYLQAAPAEADSGTNVSSAES
jgi:hypothetical protein